MITQLVGSTMQPSVRQLEEQSGFPLVQKVAMDSASLVARFRTALLGADHTALARLVEEAGAPLDLGLLERVVVPALEEIGQAWADGDVSLMEVYTSSLLCERLIEQCSAGNPSARAVQPRVAIGVLEDYHLLGKRLVLASVRAAGFEVVDFGRGDAATLAERADAAGTQVLLVSVLMLPTALRVADLRARLDERGLDTRLIVGGAPFRLDPSLWQAVGADACGDTASAAPSLIDRVAGSLM